MENTRFKIGSTQIEAVYNEAPVINYPGKNDNSKNNGVYLDKDMFLRTNKRDVSIEEANEYKKIYKATRRDI